MSAAPFTAGLVLAGRFELLRPLGSGGLAEVWSARDLVAGGEVALKALHAHLSRDAGLCERFRRELAVTRGLDHPGIVQVYDFYLHQGRPFFTLELLRGEPLAARVGRGPLPRDEALQVAREIAAALRAAHRAGVVHRDLKPHNVFLGETAPGAGERSAKPTVKLLDFGLARAAGHERMTAASTVLGTPGYIAPEVLAGATADGRADLYALGAVLFESLTGARAFPSTDAFAVLAQQGKPPRLEEALPGADPADAALVARLLEPDPERRLLDADQVLRALGGEAVPAAPEAPPALTRGGFAVVLRKRMFAVLRRARLARVLSRLGVPARGFWRRLLLSAPVRTLVTGASRASADEVARICREEGVVAQVVPAPAEGPLQWLGQREGPLSLAAAGLVAAQLAALAAHWGLCRWRALSQALAGALPLEPPWAPPEAVRRSLAKLTARVAEHPELLRAGAWLGEALLQALPGILWLSMVAGALAALVSVFPPALLGRAPRRWELGRAGAFAAALLAALGAFWLLGARAGPDGFLSILLAVPRERWYELALGLRPVPLTAMQLLPLDRARTALGPGLLAFAGVAAGALGLFAALRSKGSGLAALPEGDPAIRRLVAGIERRLAELRQRARGSPPADQAVLAGLLAAAEELASPARAIGDAAAGLPPVEAQVTLPQGTAARRDLLAGQLLQIAAGLDDALRALRSAQPAAQEQAGGALERLRAEVAAAHLPAALGADTVDGTPVDPLRRPQA